MTRLPSPAEELATLREIVDGQSIAMFSTLDADGRIVSRPMDTQEMDEEGDLWFLTEADAEKVGELSGDAHASAMYSGGRAWAVVSGTAAVVRDDARKRELWDESSRTFFGDRDPEDPSVVLIRLAAERAEFWTSHSAPRVLVELVKGRIRGEEPDVGRHAQIGLGSAPGRE